MFLKHFFKYFKVQGQRLGLGGLLITSLIQTPESIHKSKSSISKHLSKKHELCKYLNIIVGDGAICKGTCRRNFTRNRAVVFVGVIKVSENGRQTYPSHLLEGLVSLDVIDRTPTDLSIPYRYIPCELINYVELVSTWLSLSTAAQAHNYFPCFINRHPKHTNYSIHMMKATQMLKKKSCLLSREQENIISNCKYVNKTN